MGAILGLGNGVALAEDGAAATTAEAAPAEATQTNQGIPETSPHVVKTGDDLALKKDYPERYTVVEGDTLWDISSRFLKSPWNWPKIWKINDQVANPHLIYPGDVILMRWVDGQPQLSVLRTDKLPVPVPAPVEEKKRKPVDWPEQEEARVVPIPKPDLDKPRVTVGNRERLQPQVRSQSRQEAIPTISPTVIGPFLTRPLVVGRSELEKAGYVTIGRDGRRAIGTNDEFYGRNIDRDDGEFYYIFRKGRKIRSPGSRRVLGYEAVYLGEARLVEYNRSRRTASKFLVTSAAKEILPTDRLWPMKKTPPLPYYHPRSPETQVEGSIVLGHDGATQMGAMSVVVIDLGERDGLKQGHVLRILRHVGKDEDPVTGRNYKVPDEETGLMIVFRTFRRTAYGLIMKADRPVHINDVVRTP
ncbi:MAG: LysM peptidoglycan-binding domain-containing protein [Proteobacteria bacterium]|nr:LysM peptidoglycan-binding domain-containing protein [Pseudomonadota bacterium]